MNKLSTSPPPQLAPGAARPSTRTLAITLGVAVTLAWSYRANLDELLKSWTTNPDYSHGILVVPIALLIAWRLWPGPDDQSPRPTPWGVMPLVLILAIRAWSYQSGEYWLETATLVPVVAALVWTCGGFSTLRRLWPAVAFLTFMLTIPGQLDAKLSLPLQRLAARGSCSLLRATGTWVLIEGNVIHCGPERLEVARACSGLAMLASLSASICAIILVFPFGLRNRLVLLGSIVPIALLCNVTRIAATAWCYQYFGSEAGHAFAHDAAGWLMMPLAMLMVGLELAWLSWLFENAPAAPVPSRPAPVLLGAMIMGARR
ncbi:exosortase/archaeosortase family protein [Singulisphaera sp. Ch08]|uniref:Exosortase/archaeosortase family protein n=1 Tax=Singulisphaera sp. Ch08 TaxID=3120278 RepID=A0AAU7CEN8_9BACT